MSDVKRKIEGVRAKRAGEPRPIAERMGKLAEANKIGGKILVGMVGTAIRNAQGKLELELRRLEKLYDRASDDWTEEEKAAWESAADHSQTLLEAMAEAVRGIDKIEGQDF